MLAFAAQHQKRLADEMLAPLFAFIGTGEFEDNGFIRLKLAEHDADDLRLVLDSGVFGEPAISRTWVIRCTKVRDFRLLLSDCEPLQLISDSLHPLIRQFVDPQGDLVFTGSCPSAADVVGELWLAHRAAAGPWIPFERFLNESCDLADLLSGGYGKLALGPVFLLNAYAEVLSARGYAVSPLLPRPPTFWDGAAWQNQSRDLTVLRLGQSFVVANHFMLD